MNNPNKKVPIEEAFSYVLAPERIAQRPASPADSAKLLVADRTGQQVSEKEFLEIVELLKPDDHLVLNDTRVIKARLFGSLETGAEIEILLVQQEGQVKWRAMARPLKKLREGVRVKLANGLVAICGERISEQEIILEFVSTDSSQNVAELLVKAGVMPIPPYIRGGRGDDQDNSDYQAHFARNEGSIAAPTAGLHFTERLLSKVSSLGCSISYLTLHVGTASFLPIWSENESLSKTPGSERFIYDASLIGALEASRENGGRVIAVGTTVVRALESMMRMKADASRRELSTELFITPGFDFKIVDALVTNFHQPRTTHLLLVEAIMGRELLEESYKYALDNSFKFLSYGDGMFIQ